MTARRRHRKNWRQSCNELGNADRGSTPEPPSLWTGSGCDRKSPLLVLPAVSKEAARCRRAGAHRRFSAAGLAWSAQRENYANRGILRVTVARRPGRAGRRGSRHGYGLRRLRDSRREPCAARRRRGHQSCSGTVRANQCPDQRPGKQDRSRARRFVCSGERPPLRHRSIQSPVYPRRPWERRGSRLAIGRRR